jgi:LmbE family N-acetylglucosaminyl deacetylase
VVTTIAGRGTAEEVWTPWLAHRSWPQLDLTTVDGRRVVVLAAHPDDEVLGVAGLMVHLASRGHEIVIVWATDGEASHPGSTVLSSSQLRLTRRDESRAAIAHLGLTPTAMHHLGLPDGQLISTGQTLHEQLSQVVRSDDLVIAPWARDGHPDHDALGATAATLGSLTWHYPIWMWHWAAPDDVRVPWPRVHVTPVTDIGAKAAAIAHFASQVEPLGPAIEDAAILPAHVVARFLRPYEWIII